MNESEFTGESSSRTDELLTAIEAAKAEWKEKGGRPWSEVEQEMEQAVSRREAEAGQKHSED